MIPTNIPAICCSDACSVCSNCVFAIYIYIYLFWQLDTIYWLKDTCVNRTLVGCGERESIPQFYDQVLTQSFSEPVPLCCELHKCFSVFSPPLGRTGWPQWAGVWYFPSPTWKLRSDWSWIFPFSRSVRLLIILQQVRLSSFIREQVLLR